MALAAGAVGFAGAVGLQIGRGAWLGQCARTGDPASDACAGWIATDPQLAYYSAGGLAMMVAGSAGAGGMFGNAAATRDAYRGAPKEPSFAKFTGIVTIGLASAWLVGRNIHFWHRERQCDEDMGCVLAAKKQRWLYNDIGALAISFGAGMVGYSLTYTKQSKALMSLRVQPMLSRTQTGLGVSMAF